MYLLTLYFFRWLNTRVSTENDESIATSQPVQDWIDDLVSK